MDKIGEISLPFDKSINFIVQRGFFRFIHKFANGKFNIKNNKIANILGLAIDPARPDCA